MTTPVLRRDGSAAGPNASARREAISAPVPPGTTYSFHVVARQLGLATSEMVRLAIAEYVQTRLDQLSGVEQHAADVLRATDFCRSNHHRRYIQELEANSPALAEAR